MSESEYYAGDVSDAELDAVADAGDYYLEESGFYRMPSLEEMQKMAELGERLLLMDWLKIL
jgi:hypothetical protein